MRTVGWFERGGELRRAATPAQAVKLKFEGFRPVPAPEAALPMADLKLAQLRELAAERGVDLTGARTKAAVMEALNAAAVAEHDEEGTHECG